MMSLPFAMLALPLALVGANSSVLDGCKPDPSSFDLVLQCPEVVASVEEELGGDPQRMLEAHLANLVDDVPDVEVTKTANGRTATYRHGEAEGSVVVKEVGGITRVIACAGPAKSAAVKDTCSKILVELGDKGSDAFPKFFRARDVETAWGLDKGLAKTCRAKKRGNVIFEIDCESYGLMVAKADPDDNKRTSNLRKYLMGALKTHELFDDDPCTLHGAPARCIRADRAGGDATDGANDGASDGAHVVVAAAVVAGDPVQFRCDWTGGPEMPALCATHVLMKSPAAPPP